MTLDQIKYFIEVARNLSFIKAAQQLYVAQPHLSKQIALLEHEIDLKLFERTRRMVKLTPEGALLLNKLEHIPNQIEEGLVQARAFNSGTTRTLSVGILEGQELNDNITSRLQIFYEKYPHLKLNFERDKFHNLRVGLETGLYDLIITFCFDVEGENIFCHRAILKQQGAIVINKRHPLANIGNLTLDQLKDADFVVISPEESPKGYTRFIEQCGTYGFTPRVVKTTSSLENLLLCVETGTGVALLDRNTKLENNNNVRIVDISKSNDTNIGIAWRTMDKNPAITMLVQILSIPINRVETNT